MFLVTPKRWCLFLFIWCGAISRVKEDAYNDVMQRNYDKMTDRGAWHETTANYICKYPLGTSYLLSGGEAEGPVQFHLSQQSFTTPPPPVSADIFSTPPPPPSPPDRGQKVFKPRPTPLIPICMKHKEYFFYTFQ